jgi:DNA uptake protein ComE-like DNA-binding protein
VIGRRELLSIVLRGSVFVLLNVALCAGAFVLGVLTAGCNSHPSDQQIQQQAAQTTQQVKQTAQQAADNARVAAANAEDKINAVAAGVKQGMQSGPPPATVDINSATRDQLVTLPGVTSAKARQIIAARPYSAPADLVSKNVLTQDQFDRISGRVTVQ